MVGAKRVSISVCVNVMCTVKDSVFITISSSNFLPRRGIGEFCTQLLQNIIFLWARLLGESLEMDLLHLVRAWDLMKGSFRFTRTPKEFFALITLLIHYTEFHIAGEMPECFSVLYSKENQISNLPRKNEVGFVRSVGRML